MAVAGFDGVVDGDRDRLGAAGDIAGDHDGDAEIAEGAGEGEGGGGGDGAAGEGQGHAPEEAPFGGAEGAGGALVTMVDGFEGGAGGLDEQGRGVDAGGDDGGLPGEDEGGAEDGFDEVADGAGAAEQDQQVIAEDGGRQDEGEGDGGVEEFFAAEPAIGEDPGEPDSGGEREQGGKRSYAEAQPEWEPVDGGHRVWISDVCGRRFTQTNADRRFVLDQRLSALIGGRNLLNSLISIQLSLRSQDL